MFNQHPERMIHPKDNEEHGAEIPSMQNKESKVKVLNKKFVEIFFRSLNTILKQSFCLFMVSPLNYHFRNWDGMQSYIYLVSQCYMWRNPLLIRWNQLSFLPICVVVLNNVLHKFDLTTNILGSSLLITGTDYFEVSSFLITGADYFEVSVILCASHFKFPVYTSDTWDTNIGMDKCGDC